MATQSTVRAAKQHQEKSSKKNPSNQKPGALELMAGSIQRANGVVEKNSRAAVDVVYFLADYADTITKANAAARSGLALDPPVSIIPEPKAADAELARLLLILDTIRGAKNNLIQRAHFLKWIVDGKPVTRDNYLSVDELRAKGDALRQSASVAMEQVQKVACIANGGTPPLPNRNAVDFRVSKTTAREESAWELFHSLRESIGLLMEGHVDNEGIAKPGDTFTIPYGDIMRVKQTLHFALLFTQAEMDSDVSTMNW